MEERRNILKSEAVIKAERMAEAERIGEVMASGLVPPECGSDIPDAPARGGVATFRPMRVLPGTAGTAVPDGHWPAGEPRPRLGLRRADVFDAMENAARARWSGDRPFVPPFTASQVQMARAYRDLFERMQAGGYRLLRLDGTGGGGDSAGATDARLSEARWLQRLRQRVGSGIAPGLVVRNARARCRSVLDLQLVDMVCVADMSLSEVLRSHGWAVNGRTRDAARLALAAALDRMIGYR